MRGRFPTERANDRQVGAAEFIAESEAFYLASAGAAAVLLGLVFVGLSLHFERRKGVSRVRGLAIGSASSLFYVLLTSLLALVPSESPNLVRRSSESPRPLVCGLRELH